MISGFSSNHLRWPGFLEDLVASSSLKQFQVKSSVSTLELKRLLYERPPPNLEKQNFVFSPYVSIEPTMQRSFIIKVEEKPYCTFASMF